MNGAAGFWCWKGPLQAASLLRISDTCLQMQHVSPTAVAAGRTGSHWQKPSGKQCSASSGPTIVVNADKWDLWRRWFRLGFRLRFWLRLCFRLQQEPKRSMSGLSALSFNTDEGSTVA